MNSKLIQSSPIHQAAELQLPLKRTEPLYKRRVYKLLSGLTLPVVVLILWQVLGDKEYISTLLFPTPTTILDAFWNLYLTGELIDNLKISLVRMLSGFALGASLGLLIGLLVGLVWYVEKALDPTIQMIRMVPHLALTTLFVLWFGIGETAKILLIAKGSFFPLYINAYLGIRNIDTKYFDVARVLGFSRSKQLTRLIIPAIMPNLFLGIRLSVAISWLGLVVAEIMGSTSGIGYLMMDARAMSMTSTVFVGIVLFAVLGKASDLLVVSLERYMLRWRDSFQGL
ncbi:ABC transporter permease [Paenibacillus agricola]|uniref:ABC transporter permease n=1 Tax=Paenibacillus agricola TaxID=2716264 RepID=A0ABX0J8R0_9BACL|nr:ABC transporter permease [Paenibacillus agricola]NHN31780.1 ABC transporter permease [Paenibacillus agricola]